MLAREYNRLIEIWVKTFVTNEYGSLVESLVFVKKIWAKIGTNAGNKFVNYGIQDFKNPVVFHVRGRKNDIIFDENYFVKYKGHEYFIKGIENEGLEDMETIILADGI